jgi:chromosome segregation ATPase
VDNPAELQKVFGQYSHTKGPFYHALAQATASLTERFNAVSENCTVAENRCQERRQETESAEQQLSRLEQVHAAKIKELATLDGKLKGKKKLLDQATALDGLHFGPGELSRLHALLVKMAASQGASPKEAVSLFFELVDNCQSVVSLELEENRAVIAVSKEKANLERWQAEAKAAEAKAKARKSSIDLADRLLAQGVKEGDLPQWTRTLSKSGVTPENLAQTLERYASLEALILDRQKRSDELESEVASLEGQEKALQQANAGTHAAIQAVREMALAEVQQAGQDLAANLKGLDAKVQELGALGEQLGDLREEAALARAFRAADPELWGTVTSEGIHALLNAVLMWARVKGFDPQLSPPDTIQHGLLLPSWSRVNFTDLVRWAAAALVVEK